MGLLPILRTAVRKFAAGRTVIPSIGSGSRSVNPQTKVRRRLAILQHFFQIRVQRERRRPASVARHFI
jgi:hypothetical protein